MADRFDTRGLPLGPMTRGDKALAITGSAVCFLMCVFAFTPLWLWLAAWIGG